MPAFAELKMEPLITAYVVVESTAVERLALTRKLMALQVIAPTPVVSP